MRRVYSWLQSRPFWIGLTVGYTFLILFFCFSPQIPNPDLPTPGVFYRGRLAFLLTPLNSLWNLNQATSFMHLLKILLQNALNIFLLHPLLLGILVLQPNFRTLYKIVWLGFYLSLSIELGQLLLDYLWDFNRVFEMDDLWTNTLGAYLAYRTYLWLEKRQVLPTPTK
ncbi:VanZ family protein [Streptococcus sp. 121]|uniref:VanZ family protein n=1 Tax=Streptococcus sp. 121 TaxID=2797637 RepID=UPI0018F0D33E|nr:VanZ family protein [Streptococcus sp. 121]MBJ6745001.1 VanZ family protein [Streptococcus sp. 121]